MRVDTDNHTYMFRLNPSRGEYAAYCYAYDREMLEQHLTQAQQLSVLMVEPGKAPYVKKIGKELEDMQREVGGYIQAVYPYSEPVALVCGEEAKLQGLPLNRALRDEDGQIYDIVAGNFLIVGLGEEDFCSLDQKNVELFSERFKTPEEFIRMNGKLMVVPIKPKRPSVLSQLHQPLAPRKEHDSDKKQDMER